MPTLPAVFAVWFFFPIATVASGVALVLGLRALGGARAALSWPSVPGRIVRSVVIEDSFEGAPTFEAQITYEYRVGALPLTGSRIRFGDYACPSAQRARADVARWPVDTEVQVHHHPTQPQRAVLDATRPPLGVWLVVAGACGFTAVVLASIAVAVIR